MVAENPFLGPVWLPLVKVIKMLLESPEKKNFHLTTYGRKYNLSPYTSPYIQATWSSIGELQLEASANLICDPPLSDEQFNEMEFIGWTKPEVSAVEYSAGLSQGRNPNFVRYFERELNVDDVAEFFLTTLTAIYGITEEDFFNFGEFDVPEKVAALGVLRRLDKHDGNPTGAIFGLMLEGK